MSKNKKVPVWVDEFLDKIRSLRKKTKDGEIYSGEQSKLKILKKTGKGNCVAMGKLFVEILRKYQVRDVYIVQIAVNDPKEDCDHRITVVVEDIERFWLQSNEEISFFRDYFTLLKYAAKEMNWQKKGFFVRYSHEPNWC